MTEMTLTSKESLCARDNEKSNSDNRPIGTSGGMTSHRHICHKSQGLLYWQMARILRSLKTITWTGQVERIPMSHLDTINRQAVCRDPLWDRSLVYSAIANH